MWLMVPAIAIIACLAIWPAETLIGCAFVAAVALFGYHIESVIRRR